MSASDPDIHGFLQELRDLIGQDCDVEAARRLAARLADPLGAEALIPVALEMARMSPQPAARLAVGQALARLRPEFASTWRQVADIARAGADHRADADALTVAAGTRDGSRDDRLGAALAAYQDNDLARAEALYAEAGDTDEALCGRAVVAIARGATEQATALLRRVLARTPDRVEALRLLVMTAPDADAESRLGGIARDPRRGDAERSAAAFALALASDRRKDAGAAMEWASLANGLGARRARPYDRAGAEARAQALLDLFDALPPAGEPLLGEPRPLVVVGLPRSGTSIVESLLAAHPNVIAGGERTDLLLACRELEIVLGSKGVDAASGLFERRRPGLVRDLADRLFRAGIVSEAYLDKLPLHTPYAGLIARLLPEAKILFVRRDPVETALSIWLHDFSQAYPYSTDLDALAHAVVLNDRLREAWKDRLGDQFMEVDLDALCADPATEGRRLFAFCGLEWDDAYLEPDARSSATNTFSALQVREPIRPPSPRASLYRAVSEPLRSSIGHR